MNLSTNKHYHALLYDHDGGVAPSLTSNDNFSVVNGKGYYINDGTDNVSVLNATTLGSAVVNSSLTSVGTLGSLTVTNKVTANDFESIFEIKAAKAAEK